MTASREDIRAWLDEATEAGATHVLVVCDTFEHDDYPVFVMPNKSARDVAAGYNGKNMQRLMEVYNLGMDLTAQLDEPRAFHYEVPA